MTEAKKFRPEIQMTFVDTDGDQYMFFPLSAEARTGDGLDTPARRMAAFLLREALANLEYLDD